MAGSAINWESLAREDAIGPIVSSGRYRLDSPSTVTGSPTFAMAAAEQSAEIRVFLPGGKSIEAPLAISGTTAVSLVDQVGKPFSQSDLALIEIEVAMPYGQNLLTTDEPNGSPSAPFTTEAERTAWTTANLASLLPGRTTAWGPGNQEYRFVGPEPDKWVIASENIMERFESEREGIFRSMRRISVKADGSGDFTEIQAAINSIADASVANQYVIDVYDDFTVTDPLALYLVNSPITKQASATAVTQYIAVVVMKDFVHLNGVGGRRAVKCIMPTTLTDASYKNIQAQWNQGNVITNNIDFVIQGGRYARHQDMSNGFPDKNAFNISAKIVAEHRGNKTSDGYPAGAWSSCYAEANGTSDGLRTLHIDVAWKTVHKVGFYFHGNMGYTSPTKHKFVNCSEEASGARDNLPSLGYIDMGSGVVSSIDLVGCRLSTFTLTNMAYGAEQQPSQANLFDNGGAVLSAYGNSKMTAVGIDRSTLFFNNNTPGGSIAVIGGSAYGDIWGGEGVAWKAGSNIGAYTMGKLRLQEPTPGVGTSYIYSLSYRLGNCAASPKTLIIKIGGTDRTLTFDQNYMTADGSPYTVTTVPAIASSAIVTAMNAALSAWGAACNTNIGSFKLITPNDCVISLVNRTALACRRGMAVVRVGSDGLRLAAAGETPFGITAEWIAPGDVGSVIPTDKSDFSVVSTIRVGSTTPGTMYNTASEGGFSVTSNPSEAKMIAIDSWTLAKYQPPHS